MQSSSNNSLQKKPTSLLATKASTWWSQQCLVSIYPFIYRGLPSRFHCNAAASSRRAAAAAYRRRRREAAAPRLAHTSSLKRRRPRFVCHFVPHYTVNKDGRMCTAMSLWYTNVYTLAASPRSPRSCRQQPRQTASASAMSEV